MIGLAQSSDRVLAVIAAFRLERPVLTLSDVVELTGLPVSTAHRLLERLVAWGVLEKDDRKRYAIGSRLWEKAMLSPKHFQQRTAAVPYLERVFLATHRETVLTVLHADGSLVVEQVLGWMDGPRAAGLGDHLPLHATSPGLVALAFGPRGLWASVSARPLARYTARTIADVERLALRLRVVRKEGVAVSDGGLVPGTTSASAPVFDRAGSLYGAVSLVWPSGAGPSGEEVDAIRATARSISEALRTVDPHSAPHTLALHDRGTTKERSERSGM